MPIALVEPAADDLTDVLSALRDWQSDELPVQLHPGDVGWFWRFGAVSVAAALRVWLRGGVILAVGLLDEPTLLRLAIAPDVQQDEELAHVLVADLIEPTRGVLPDTKVYMEAPKGATLHELLTVQGWSIDEPWTPLRRDLADPVNDPGLRVDVIGPEDAHVRTCVQRAAFEGSTFTDERWHAMAAGPLYADARCVVAFDERSDPVAAVTVWSAGPGKPGLLEPMGVHRDHRGHGYGTAITVAAARVLRELGSSSASVCTPSSNVGAVATYESAGFVRLPEMRDRCRDLA